MTDSERPKEGLIRHKMYYLPKREDYLIISIDILIKRDIRDSANPYCMSQLLAAMEFMVNNKNDQGITMSRPDWQEKLYNEYSQVPLLNSIDALIFGQLFRKESGIGTSNIYYFCVANVNSLIAEIPSERKAAERALSDRLANYARWKSEKKKGTRSNSTDLDIELEVSYPVKNDLLPGQIQPTTHSNSTGYPVKNNLPLPYIEKERKNNKKEKNAKPVAEEQEGTGAPMSPLPAHTHTLEFPVATVEQTSEEPREYIQGLRPVGEKPAPVTKQPAKNKQTPKQKAAPKVPELSEAAQKVWQAWIACPWIRKAPELTEKAASHCEELVDYQITEVWQFVEFRDLQQELGDLWKKTVGATIPKLGNFTNADNLNLYELRVIRWRREHPEKADQYLKYTNGLNAEQFKAAQKHIAVARAYDGAKGESNTPSSAELNRRRTQERLEAERLEAERIAATAVIKPRRSLDEILRSQPQQ